MLDKNCKKILTTLTKNDKVLDIGGWAIPFTRANYVVDLMPYESRGIHGRQGSQKEHFTKKNWILLDISSKALPFKNKEFDFVICSHTLEDLKDPMYACAEIIRVGKSGYIEVPSRTVETIMGIEGADYAGYAHHRWLVEIKDDLITFRFKNHFIHHSWKYHLPYSYKNNLTAENQVSYLFWKNTFQTEEIITPSSLSVRKEMERFVKSKHAYPDWFYTWFVLDTHVHALSHIKSLLLKSPQLKKIAYKLFGNRVNKSLAEEHFWEQMGDIHLLS